MASKDILLPLTEELQNAKIAPKLEFIELKQRSIIQGDIFFYKEANGTIYFDLAAKIDELFAIFTFLGASNTLKNGVKSGQHPYFIQLNHT